MHSSNNNDQAKTAFSHVIADLKAWSADSNSKRLFLKTTVVPAAVACIEKMMMHPVDTIVTFQQQRNITALAAATHISHQYGSLGFYRGLTIPVLLSAIPGNILVYGTYVGCKDYFARQYGLSQNSNFLLSGLVVGNILSVLSTPIEAARIRATLGAKVSCKRNTAYYFRGFVPNTIKLNLCIVTMLSGTDILKEQFQKHCSLSMDSSVSVFGIALAMGMFAQVLSTPIDVIKTQMMNDYAPREQRLSLFQHTQQTIREKNLMTGLAARMLRLGVQPAIMLSLMHVFNQFFEQSEEKKPNSTLSR